jgi:hypothetical protein
MGIDGWQGEIHPAAALFPLIEGEAFDELVADIKVNGLREACWLNADGVLLDGRNRIRACQAAGVKPSFRQFSGEDEVGFIVSLNLKRRQLSKSQAAMLAVDILPMYEAESKKRQGQRSDLKRRIEEPLDIGAPVHQSARRPRAADNAAAATGVSGRAVGQAKRITENAPDLAEDVRQGRKNLKEAEAEVRRREAEQRARAERQAEIDAIVNKLGAGETIVVNMRDDISKVLEAKGLLVRIDRGTPWGNPFILDDDGDRETVIASYADHYLPHKPSLLCRLDSLRGKALGCWCAPLPCHGDALKELIV